MRAIAVLLASVAACSVIGQSTFDAERALAFACVVLAVALDAWARHEMRRIAGGRAGAGSRSGWAAVVVGCGLLVLGLVPLRPPSEEVIASALLVVSLLAVGLGMVYFGLEAMERRAVRDAGDSPKPTVYSQSSTTAMALDDPSGRAAAVDSGGLQRLSTARVVPLPLAGVPVVRAAANPRSLRTAEMRPLVLFILMLVGFGPVLAMLGHWLFGGRLR
jgi:hypothetical protein